MNTLIFSLDRVVSMDEIDDYLRGADGMANASSLPRLLLKSSCFVDPSPQHG